MVQNRQHHSQVVTLLLMEGYCTGYLKKNLSEDGEVF